jgi:hypothetical protein
MSDETRNGGEAPEGWGPLGESFRADPADASSFEGVDGGAVRARAETFARKIRRRNLREVAAGAFVVAGGVTIAARAPTALGLAGGVAMALGAIFVSVFIFLRARNLRAPEPAAPTSEVVAYERAQLERQARLLERVWLWYLAPLLPSVALIYAESLQRALDRPDPTGGVALTAALFAASLGVFVVIGWINKRAARGLRERMAQLPPPA